MVSKEVAFINDRQKVQITVEKQDAENGAVLAGAEFGLYNAGDIVSGEKTIVEADILLETVVSDENGKAVFTLDLPLGQYLSVLDKDGNVIDSWVSVKDEPHVIKRLAVGETYTLREDFALFGYLKATDVTFTVEDTAEIQKVVMKDEAVPTNVPKTGDETNL